MAVIKFYENSTSFLVPCLNKHLFYLHWQLAMLMTVLHPQYYITQEAWTERQV